MLAEAVAHGIEVRKEILLVIASKLVARAESNHRSNYFVVEFIPRDVIVVLKVVIARKGADSF
jgi:hypothetical protein